MARISRVITPTNRVPRWKKNWATPRLLDEDEATAAFEEFQEQFIPSRMNKKFLQFFGNSRAQFGNRFFMDDAVYHSWDTSFVRLGAGETGHVEAIVIYALNEDMEATWLKGQTRRSLRDVVIDDWQAACAIVRAEKATYYMFVEPRMKGVIVRTVPNEESD